LKDEDELSLRKLHYFVFTLKYYNYRYKSWPTLHHKHFSHITLNFPFDIVSVLTNVRGIQGQARSLTLAIIIQQ